MIEIKGVIEDCPEGEKRTTVFCHLPDLRGGKFITVPEGSAKDKESISKFVAKECHVTKDKISWRKQIDIPKIKPKLTKSDNEIMEAVRKKHKQK